MKPVTKKKKAFTLTELLVVVVVIGVLSAVVLPKFNKVMETRKTTEAEEMMAAVRTEQEKRCALDKNYLQDLSKMSDIIPNTDTKNFTYVATATGIKAHSKGKYGYTLEMPSYRDGRLCCESDECAKLNKDYPSCSALVSSADYLSGEECKGDESEEESSVKDCTAARPSNTQTCSNGCGTQTRTVSCNTSTGQWETGAWSGSCECECSGVKPTETQVCNDCGTQTRTVECDTSTGDWVASAWSSCSKTQQECDEENKEEDEDCCADDVTDFAACILKKYGASSTEYVCAVGKNVGYIEGLGSLSGAAACSSVLGMGSTVVRASAGKCDSKYCQEVYNNANISWISGGFKKYACTREKPVIPDSSGSSEDNKYNCCRVELAPKQEFHYSDISGKVDCDNAAGTSRCPASIKPGVRLNMSHQGTLCVYSYSCPFAGWSSTHNAYHGYVQRVRCVNYGDRCTQDEITPY